MYLTWHIIRKDLIRLRIQLLAWTLLIAAKHLFFCYLAGIWGEPNFALLASLQGGPGWFLSLFAEPLVTFFLVANLVYEDPPAGKDPFWMTRPISGGRLLAAKLLGAELMFVVWPILLSLPWWIACGCGPAAIVSITAIMAVFYSTVVLVGLAGASATDSYPRYILWTLAAFATFAVALILTIMLRLQNTPGISSPEAAVVYLGIIVSGLILISLEIIRHQFVVRNFRWHLVLLTGGTLLATVLAFTSPWPGLVKWLHRSDPVNPEDVNVQLSLVGPMRLKGTGKNPVGALEASVRIEGLPGAATGFLWIEGTWKSAAAKVWSARGDSPRQLFISRSSRYILHFPPADLPSPIASVQFIFARRFAERIADEAVSFRGVATLHLNEGRLLAEVPVREQAKRFDGGSLSITKLQLQGNLLTFNFSARSSVYAWMMNQYPSYFAVVNRSTGEVIEPDHRTWQRIGSAQINLIGVAAAPVSFTIPTTPGWLERASFVVIGYDRARWVKRNVEWQQSAKAIAPAERKPTSLSPEILRNYVGTYVPKEKNVTVLIALEGDHLVARITDTSGVRSADIPEMILFPESENRFSVADANVEFIKDDRGAVTHMVVHQNGQDFTVPRTSDSVPPR